MKKRTEISIIAGGAFAAGIMAGLLLDPKVKEAITNALKNSSGKAEQWVNVQKQAALLRIEKGIMEIKEKLDRNLADPLPDLYKATEGLVLDEDDLPGN